jgi:acyl dehydratase
MTTTVRLPRELLDLVGTELGTSDWVDIDQARIDRFADATGDHQWIHVDPERAATGPFGTTIAHGYLTLSLVVPMIEAILQVTDKTSSINYGLDKVRFPAAVPVDSKIRMRATLAEATEIPGGVQVVLDCVIEIDGADRPACVARAIHRHLAEEPER